MVVCNNVHYMLSKLPTMMSDITFLLVCSSSLCNVMFMQELILLRLVLLSSERTLLSLLRREMATALTIVTSS